ncbi:MAG TPA: DUF6391 domain-containing protein [Nitrolancea sp.]|nr:DUF6391 domain-containing protein [Nitrolancea sp.]
MFFFFFAFVAFAFVVLLVLVSTVGFTLASLVTLFSAPSQFSALLRDRQLRRNHALEHATINVIEQRYGASRLAGLAENGGFNIQGGASPDLVASAAQEALDRLKAGERKLAIHPRCGTSLIAAQLVMAVVFIVAVILLRDLSWIAFAAGLLAAIVLGPRLSLIVQRFVTTDARVGNLQITSVEVKRPDGRMGIFSMMILGPVFVHTAEVSETGAKRQARRDGRAEGDVTLITGDREEIPAGGYRVR